MTELGEHEARTILGAVRLPDTAPDIAAVAARGEQVRHGRRVRAGVTALVTVMLVAATAVAVPLALGGRTHAVGAADLPPYPAPAGKQWVGMGRWVVAVPDAWVVSSPDSCVAPDVDAVLVGGPSCEAPSTSSGHAQLSILVPHDIDPGFSGGAPAPDHVRQIDGVRIETYENGCSAGRCSREVAVTDGDIYFSLDVPESEQSVLDDVAASLRHLPTGWVALPGEDGDLSPQSVTKVLSRAGFGVRTTGADLDSSGAYLAHVAPGVASVVRPGSTVTLEIGVRDTSADPPEYPSSFADQTLPAVVEPGDLAVLDDQATFLVQDHSDLFATSYIDDTNRHLVIAASNDAGEALARRRFPDQTKVVVIRVPRSADQLLAIGDRLNQDEVLYPYTFDVAVDDDGTGLAIRLDSQPTPQERRHIDGLVAASAVPVQVTVDPALVPPDPGPAPDGG